MHEAPPFQFPFYEQNRTENLILNSGNRSCKGQIPGKD